MSVTIDQVYREALELPDESKVSLTERLVAYLESHIDPEIQRQHLVIVRDRRARLLSGEVQPIDGPDALKQGRQRLGQ
jgi:Putative addiction module component